MAVPRTDPEQAAGGGAASAHRLLARIFLGALVIQFFLAGLGSFDGEWEAHQAFGSLLVLIGLVLVILAAVGRRVSLPTSAVLLGLLIVQSVLAIVGEDVAIIGALHPVNALVILALAGMTSVGRPLGFRHAGPM